MARAHLDVDYALIASYVDETSRKHAERAARNVRDRARAFAPKKTGWMAANIEVELVSVHGGVAKYQVVSPVKYSGYQEEGTGPIFARPGSFLVWNEGGVTIFAKKTRGVPAAHFMRRAVDLGSEADFLI